MSEKAYRYVYGPVPSRRLGRSLGIDLVPYKTCTYDCIYCQLGRTTNKTIEMKEYVPLDEVVSEIKHRLDTNPSLDYITISGSGEPTLYIRLAELIQEIKKRTSIPLAVLTNGSLLWNQKVRESLMEADLVIPSLDAGDKNLFQSINRPHSDINFEKMIAGTADFRRQFSGEIWLEVFLLERVTGTPFEVGKISHLARRINPDRVQLNTVLRPTAVKFANAVPRRQMRELARIFGDHAEVIADFPHENQNIYSPITKKDVYDLLRRRPCTLQDITDGLHIRPNEAIKQIDSLLSKNLVTTQAKNERIFFTLPKDTR